MLKKAMAAAAVAASVIGVSAAVAPQALAIGNDTGTTALSGNEAFLVVRYEFTPGLGDLDAMAAGGTSVTVSTA